MTAIKELARRYLRADNRGAKISLAQLETEGLVPRDSLTAMAVQCAFVEASEKPVKGWKLAIQPNGESICAPMLDCYHVDDNNIAVFPEVGTEGIEVEICFTLSADIPAATDKPLTRTDLMRYIDKVHLGVELLRYRLAEKNQVPFPLFLADRLANHGFAIGPPVEEKIVEVFAGSGDALPLLVVTEGLVELFNAAVKHPNVDPLAPLLAFANGAFNTGGMLKAGNVVTTGSLCGVIPGTLSADTHIRLESVGAFTLIGPKD